MNPTATELKFLLQLLASPQHRSPLDLLKPTPKISAADRVRLCQKLTKRGWVDRTETITQFGLAAPGRVLLGLDTTSLPVTPDELRLLQNCRDKTLRPDDLPDFLSPSQRQTLIQTLADRGLILILRRAITDVWLTPEGLDFLRHECEPKGTVPLVSGDLLVAYVQLLRHAMAHSSGSGNGDQSTGDETTAQQPQPLPSLAQVLQVICDLDRELNSGNYLPLFLVRQKLQPPFSREGLDGALYELQRNDLIELGSIQEVSHYTPEQLQAGIPQNVGGSLFFVSTR